MSFENYFPLWNDLNTAQKKLISDNLITRNVKKGTIIHNGNMDCTGLLLVKSGQLRTYILSDEGREITLYRLFDMDMCLLSASCIIRSIQFEVTIEAEKDTDLWIIPAEIYKGIMKDSAPVANYTNELMATRFSDVMWLCFYYIFCRSVNLCYLEVSSNWNYYISTILEEVIAPIVCIKMIVIH